MYEKLTVFQFIISRSYNNRNICHNTHISKDENIGNYAYISI